VRGDFAVVKLKFKNQEFQEAATAAVCYDAFAADGARTNLQQSFDQFSPSTSIKVI